MKPIPQDMNEALKVIVRDIRQLQLHKHGNYLEIDEDARYLQLPVVPVVISGSDQTQIIRDLLSVLESLGLVTDETTL